MKKRKEPGMFAESNQEEDSKTLKKHEELKKLKNWARIKIIKRESDRTKLN
jgi:hypothetical protein